MVKHGKRGWNQRAQFHQYRGSWSDMRLLHSTAAQEPPHNQGTSLWDCFTYPGEGNKSPLLLRSRCQLPGTCRITWQPFLHYSRPVCWAAQDWAACLFKCVANLINRKICQRKYGTMAMNRNEQN